MRGHWAVPACVLLSAAVGRAADMPDLEDIEVDLVRSVEK
jgi:hypothetical protein